MNVKGIIMNTKNDVTRLSLDLPTKDHKEMKTLAALTGKTIRDLFLEAIPWIKETNECKLSEHIPNEETLESIRNIEAGKNLTEYKSADELFKKFGI